MQEIKYVTGKQERFVSLSENLSFDSNLFSSQIISLSDLFQYFKQLNS